MIAPASTAVVPPAPRARLVAAVLFGLAAACYTAACLATRATPSDFEVWWQATRLWLHGVDPYRVGPGMAGWPFDGWLFYPMPALLATVPVAPLPMWGAGALLMGASVGTLAWALAREGWWRLWLLASPGGVMACKLGQWSPALLAAALLPSLGALAMTKPTLGVAMLAYRLDRRAMVLALVALLASVLAMPAWPREWLANLARIEGHLPPILSWTGAPLALALLRWRRAEARLLVAMACVPQLLFFADQLAVGMVAANAREQKMLSACGLAAWTLWLFRVQPGDLYVLAAAPYVLAGVYLPALVLVLRRPNEGTLPHWLQRASPWLRPLGAASLGHEGAAR